MPAARHHPTVAPIAEIGQFRLAIARALDEVRHVSRGEIEDDGVQIGVRFQDRRAVIEQDAAAADDQRTGALLNGPHKLQIGWPGRDAGEEDHGVRLPRHHVGQAAITGDAVDDGVNNTHLVPLRQETAEHDQVNGRPVVRRLGH